MGRYGADLTFLRPFFTFRAGVSTPERSVQGKSLSPLFDGASLNGTSVAFAQYDRCPSTGTSDPVGMYHGPCKQTKRGNIGYMGFTVRTPLWRYTAWLRWDGHAQRGKWGDCPATAVRGAGGDGFCARALYSHPADEDMADFDSFELENVASDPANAATVSQLHAMLRTQFDGDQ